jgi:hypothetical protein
LNEHWELCHFWQALAEEGMENQNISLNASWSFQTSSPLPDMAFDPIMDSGLDMLSNVLRGRAIIDPDHG